MFDKRGSAAPSQPSEQDIMSALVSALESKSYDKVLRILSRPDSLGIVARLLLEMGPSLLERLSNDQLRRHRRSLYAMIAKPVGQSINCDPEDIACWIERKAEPDANLDVGQRQGAERAARALGAQTLLLEVRYEREAKGVYTERVLAWLVDERGAQEISVSRAVALDNVPDAARIAFSSAQQRVSFQLIK